MRSTDRACSCDNEDDFPEVLPTSVTKSGPHLSRDDQIEFPVKVRYYSKLL